MVVFARGLLLLLGDLLCPTRTEPVQAPLNVFWRLIRHSNQETTPGARPHFVLRRVVCGRPSEAAGGRHAAPLTAISSRRVLAAGTRQPCRCRPRPFWAKYYAAVGRPGSERSRSGTKLMDRHFRWVLRIARCLGLTSL